MAKQLPGAAPYGDDIGRLYTRFGQPGEAAHYRELLRDQAALHAALRWPLLAEVQGMEPEPPAA